LQQNYVTSNCPVYPRLFANNKKAPHPINLFITFGEYYRKPNIDAKQGLVMMLDWLG
jgi:hypothetical protein